jgi:hypothetical protein
LRPPLEEYERDSRSLDATDGLIVQEIDESLFGLRPDRESDQDAPESVPKRRRRRA